MLAFHVSFQLVSSSVRGRADRTLYSESNVFLLNVPGNIPFGGPTKATLQTIPCFSAILLPPLFQSRLNQGINFVVIVWGRPKILSLVLSLYVGPQFCSTAKRVATQVRAGNAEIHMPTLDMFRHILAQLLTVIAHSASIKCLPCSILLHPDFRIHKLFNIYGRKENDENPIFIVLNPR